jgi:2-methylcitrate dehydratase PrpD
MEFKPYSSARPIHNAIDCALDVRRQLRGRVPRIRAITMRRHPAWAKYHLNARPRSYHEAQVSLPFSTAVALVEGAALLPQYQDDRLTNPEIVRLASLVNVVPDDTLPRGVSCLMIAETTDGEVARAQVDHPRGSIVNPMTEDEMRAKVHMLADPVIGPESTGAMIDAVAHITDLGTISQLTKLLTYPAA